MKIVIRLQNSLFAIALLILAFALLVYGAYAVNLMQFPFDYDQGEGFELVDSMMLATGEMPYRDTEVYPFYASNYPPFYHVMAIPFVWAFGDSYWYGRLLGFAATIVTASAIAYAVWGASRSSWVALLSGLAFLSANTIYHIGPLFRQHITMVMFETLAVVLLASAVPNKQRWRVALAFGLLILAGYTKQLAAITAIAALVWFFLQNPRRAFLWGTGFAFVGGAVFLWLNTVTDGEWWRQAIVANTGKLDVLQVFALFNLYGKLYGFLLVPAVIYGLYELYFSRMSIYTVWFVLALLLGGTASGTWGGGDSYFATSIAALCILSGIFLGRLAQGTFHLPLNVYSRPLAVLRAQPALLAVGMLVVPLLYAGYGRATFKMPTDGFFAPITSFLGVEPNIMGRFYDSASYDVGGYAHIGHLTTQADIDAGNHIVEVIQSSDQPTLSEEAGFALVADRPVITNPTQLYNLDKAGLFEGDALLAMIESQTFAHIVLRARFYPVPVLVAIDQQYQLLEIVEMNGFNYEILVPRAQPLKRD